MSCAITVSQPFHFSWRWPMALQWKLKDDCRFSRPRDQRKQKALVTRMQGPSKLPLPVKSASKVKHFSCFQ